MKNGLEIRFSLAILIATIALGTISGCAKQEPVKDAIGVKPIVKVHLLTIAESADTQTFDAVGVVRATYNAALASKVLGRVVSVSVHDGEAVSKGQTLLSLDSRDFEASVAMASANYHSSVIGVSNALTVAEMEAQTSKAKVAQAESQVIQARAALSAAEAKRDLAVAGPRRQEVTQSHLAVTQAESDLKLAKHNRDRISTLVNEGAMAGRELDIAENRFEVAKAQYDTVVQSENIAREGSRSQEIQAAQDQVLQAKAAVSQAQSAVIQAKAAVLQALVRKNEVEVARSQVDQTSASVQTAKVGLSNSLILAPFDGRVTQRLVDPGAMANPGVALLNVEGGAFRLEAVVPERVLKYLSVGVLLPVHIDSILTGALTGRVDVIVPQADPLTHSFVVKIALPGHGEIKSGMYGSTAIPLASDRLVMIPAGSTWMNQGLNYVYAVDNQGVARIRIVTLGKTTGTLVEVLSGLSPRDRIVDGDRNSISDGTKVEGI